MTTTTPALAPVKCLLVDDLPENLLALSALLRRDAEVELLTARSGVEALELLLVHDVALALLDVQMPDMDGFELAELIRGSERTRHVPLIFVTAGARDQHRLFRGYETGAVDFLYKPIDPVILRNKADVFFQLYRQKRQLAEELQLRSETLRLNELFVAMLGHDLRNPLTAIVTSATLLQRRSADPVVQHTARQMLEGGKRMSRMVEYLLDLTRARLAGGIALNRAPVDLGSIVQQVVGEHAGMAPQEGRIEVVAEGDLHGDWDADRLAQVASNLIGNALHHGDSTQPVQVRLDGSAADSVTMQVINAGTIDAGLLPHIFDPFRGRERASAAGEGLGLGLYIVQQIVQAHGGTVEASSEEDSRFTCFTVSLRRIPGGPLGC